MARRTEHRTRVETSLEMKCLLLFGLSLLVVVSVSFWLYWQVTQEVVEAQNPRAGRLLVDQTLNIAHWKVFAGGDQRVIDYLESLGTELSQQTYRKRIIKPPSDWSNEPGSDDRPADQVEQDILTKFMRVPDEDSDEPDWDSRIIVNGDDEVYQYYQAIRAPSKAEGKCLDCHNALRVPPRPKLVEGDLIAIVQVSFPNQSKDTIRWSWAWFISVAIITAFLAIVAFYLVIRYLIIRPLRHLRDVSDAIGRGGDIAARAEIHTGDEFEALAIAFNRMLRHLAAVQEELRAANVDLDGKVDQLAQMNVQLYEMNRLKSDFMSTMSHELRTPLNSILGFSDVLKTVQTLDDKQKRYVENIHTSGGRLLNMINDILDLAKIEAGQLELRLTDFPVGQLVTTQCDLARPLSDKKRIDLDVDIETNPPAMRQDESRMQQILNNLLSNAIKFTPEGGRIQVTARRVTTPMEGAGAAAAARASEDGSIFLLQVADTGVGIAEEDQQIVFEKFRQGQTTMPGGDAMTREASGTGLGLSICREICRLLGGEISVKSELGCGSTFTVLLPWRQKEPPKQESRLPEEFKEFSRIWKTRGARLASPHSNDGGVLDV